ncbi:putative SMARCAL1-like protein [Aphelenchoides fujianensis]|nr:putative SMARCAL1-like protein [Aphelenchoides fujianensis]
MIVCVSSIFRLRVGVRLAAGGRAARGLGGVFSSLAAGCDEKNAFSEAWRFGGIVEQKRMATTSTTITLDPTVRARIEANRQAALEKQRQAKERRAAEQNAAGGSGGVGGTADPLRPPPSKIQLTAAPTRPNLPQAIPRLPAPFQTNAKPPLPTAPAAPVRPLAPAISAVFRPSAPPAVRPPATGFFVPPRPPASTSTSGFRPRQPNGAANSRPNAAAAALSWSKPPPDPLKGYRSNVELEYKPYHKEILRAIKSFEGGFTQHLDTGFISFKHYNQMLQLLRQLPGCDTTVKELPKWILDNFKDELAGVERVEQEPLQIQVEEDLLSKMFPYQLKGLHFGIQKRGCLLLADEMGLGKSVQALAIARAYSNQWPLLIVCPSSVRYSWKTQFERFLPDIDDDECHSLKNTMAARTKAAMKLAETAQHRILLSGTPALNRPAELFSQIKIVDKKILPDFKQFAERYCDYRQGRFGMEAKGAENMEELGTLLKHTCMIRRLKSDVLQDLPEKRRQIQYLTGKVINERLMRVAEARKACEAVLSKKNVKKEEKKRTIMEYYLQTGEAKADSVADHIIDTCFYPSAPPCKILVFAHHKTVMDILSTRFAAQNINYMRMDGSTSGPQREAFVKQFQAEDSPIQVAILSISACSTGITLTAANRVFFAELYWTPAILIQAEDRAHRIGQKSPVICEYILAKKTADVDIWPKVKHKLNILATADLNSEDFGGMANKERELDDSVAKITDFFSVLEKEDEDKENSS